MRRASSIPEMTRILMPVSPPTWAMKSPPLSASRMAEVAAATISSTLWESARRRNFVRVCRAEVMAVGVRLRPSRPPAPRRTISFSLSMTSKDRSGRTRTTIMWIELVPMSIAAMRMLRGDQRPCWRGPCLLHQRYILPVRPDPPHPTMNRSLPLVRLLDRRSRALKRQLAAAIAGKDAGVHQARVASRRLREAVPVLTEGLHHTKGGKAQRKIRKLTEALGTVRELDVALHLIDELAERPAVPRPALAEVRAQVIEEREARRAVMLKRLDEVNSEKLERRLLTVRK